MNFNHNQLLLAAASLFEPGETVEARGGSEYQRGVCELIGRLVLDFGGQGEGTSENAELYARRLTAMLRYRGA